MSSSPSSSSSSELALSGLAGFDHVTCTVDVVLGTGSMRVRECLNLRKHAVIPLQQIAGADLRVLINGVLVAQGEVVIVDDTTAIRVTEIVQPSGELP